MKENTNHSQQNCNREAVTDKKEGHIRNIVLVMLLLAIIFSTGAMAGDDHGRKGYKDKFVIDFGDQQFNGHYGEPNTLYLKKALRRQYPRVNVSDYRLRRVVLVAKTYHGRGKAQLRVGPEMTDLYNVGGHPEGFHGNRHGSFDKVKIRNPFRDSWGPWQLYLRGTFKVRQVVLVVEKRERENYGWSQYEYPERHYYDWRSEDGRFYFNMRWY